MDAHRVDAVAKGNIARQLEIGGRKSKPGAAAGTAHHPAGHAPPVAHHLRRPADVPLRQLGANGGGGKHLARVADLGHDANAKAMRRAGLLQGLGITRALAAEAKIITDDDMAHAEPCHQHALDEGIGRQGGSGRVEGQNEGQIQPKALQQGELRGSEVSLKCGLSG